MIGGGSWGTSVASLMSRNADVILWARSSETVTEINQSQRNSRYLADLALHPNLKATTDLGQAVKGADAVIMGVPSNSFREVLINVVGDLKPDASD